MTPSKELDERISIAIAHRQERSDMLAAQQAARLRIMIKYATESEIELDPESNIEARQQAGE